MYDSEAMEGTEEKSGPSDINSIVHNKKPLRDQWFVNPNIISPRKNCFEYVKAVNIEDSNGRSSEDVEMNKEMASELEVPESRISTTLPGSSTIPEESGEASFKVASISSREQTKMKCCKVILETLHLPASAQIGMKTCAPGQEFHFDCDDWSTEDNKSLSESSTVSDVKESENEESNLMAKSSQSEVVASTEASKIPPDSDPEVFNFNKPFHGWSKETDSRCGLPWVHQDYEGVNLINKGVSPGLKGSQPKRLQKRQKKKFNCLKLSRRLLDMRTTCRKCLRKSTTYSLNLAHEQSLHPFMCQICPDALFSFVDKNDLKNHKKKMHLNEYREVVSEKMVDSEVLNIDKDINIVSVKNDKEFIERDDYKQNVHEENFRTKLKPGVDLNMNKPFKDNNIKTGTYLVTKPTRTESGTSWNMEQIENNDNSSEDHKFHHINENRQQQPQCKVTLPLSGEEAVVINEEEPLQNKSLSLCPSNLWSTDLLVAPTPATVGTWETLPSVGAKTRSCAACPNAVPGGNQGIQSSNLTNDELPSKARTGMIQPPMKIKGVSIKPLVLSSVKVESSTKAVAGGNMSVKTSSSTSDRTLTSNMTTGMIRPPMRRGEGVKAGGVSTKPLVSSTPISVSTWETSPSVKVESSCAAESPKADIVRYQGVKSEGIPSNMKIRMIRPPMRGRGGLKTRGPAAPLLRGMRPQMQMGRGAVRMPGHRLGGIGIQAHRPRVTGIQAHTPGGIRMQAHRPRVTGMQGHRPRGIGMQGHRPAAIGNQGNRPRGVGMLAYRPVAAGMQAHGPRITGMQTNGPRVTGTQAHRPRITGMRAHGPRITGMQAHGPRITGMQAHGPRITGMQAHGPRITGMQAHGPRINGMQANRLGVPRQPFFGGLRPRMTTNSGACGEAHPKTVSFSRAPKYPIASVRLGDAGAPPPQYLKPTTASHSKEINVPTRPMGAQSDYPDWKPVDPTNLPRAPLPKVIKVEPIDISDEEPSPPVKEESLFTAPEESLFPAPEKFPSPATEESPSPSIVESSSAMLDQFKNLKSLGISVTRNTTPTKSKMLENPNSISLTPVKDK